MKTAFTIWTWTLALFILAPFAVIVGTSLNGGDYIVFPPDTLSIRWFVAVFRSADFRSSMATSIFIALLSSICSIVIALPAVISVSVHQWRGKDMLVTLFLSPITLPGIVLATGLLAFVSTTGLGLGFWPLLIAHTVITFPYAFRTLLANYDRSIGVLQEASRVLGAGSVQTAWYIVIPALRRGIVASFLLCFLVSFDEVAISLLLSSPQWTTLPVVIFSYLIVNFDPAVSAVATLQIVLSIALVLGAERSLKINSAQD